MLALDLDCAIATRARQELGARVRGILDDEGGGFYSAVLTLLMD